GRPSTLEAAAARARCRSLLQREALDAVRERRARLHAREGHRRRRHRLRRLVQPLPLRRAERRERARDRGRRARRAPRRLRRRGARALPRALAQLIPAPASAGNVRDHASTNAAAYFEPGGISSDARANAARAAVREPAAASASPSAHCARPRSVPSSPSSSSSTASLAWSIAAAALPL